MKDKSINDPFYLQIQREIDRVEKKVNTYTWFFYLIRISQIAFTAAITIFSAYTDLDRIWVVVLGAITTALIAVDTLFQVEGKKNTYKLVLFELRSIRSKLVYYSYTNKADDLALREGLFEQYKNANAYARDLIGSDSERNTNDRQAEATA